MLLTKPTLQAWAVGLGTASELPDQPNGEPVISEHLLLALLLFDDEEGGETLSESKHR